MIQRFSVLLSWCRRVGAVTAAASVMASPLQAGVELEWTDTFGRAGHTNVADSSVKIVADSDGNSVLLGVSQNGRTGKDWFVQKCDSATGKVLWVYTYDGPSHGDDVPGDLIVDSTGDVIVAGTSAATSGQQDLRITKLSGGTGAVAWSHVEAENGGISGYYYPRLGTHPSGDVLCVARFSPEFRVIGQTISTSPGQVYPDSDRNSWIGRISRSDGAVLWRAQAPEFSVSEADSTIAADAAGDVYVGHEAARTLRKYASASGVLLWYSEQGGKTIDLRQSGVVRVGSRNSAAIRTLDPGTGAVLSSTTLLDSVVNIEADGTVVSAGRVEVGKSGPTGASTWGIRIGKYSGYGSVLQWQATLKSPGTESLTFDKVEVVAGGDIWTSTDSRSRRTLTLLGSATGEVVRQIGSESTFYTGIEKFCVDGDGNVLASRLSNYIQGVSLAQADVITTKYSGTNGSELWAQTYRGLGPENEAATAIAEDASGSIFVTGGVTRKYDPATGAILWESRRGGNALAVVANGDVLVTGSAIPSAQESEFFTTLYSGQNGAVIWQQSHGLQAGSHGSAWMVKPVSGEHAYLTEAASNGNRLRLFRASDGAQVWERPLEASPSGMAVNSVGDVVVIGSESLDWLTTKFAKADGTQAWQARYAGEMTHNYRSEPGPDRPVAVATDSHGDVFVTGASAVHLEYPVIYDAEVTIKYSGDVGGVIWKNTRRPRGGSSYPYEPMGQLRPADIVIHPSGDAIVASYEREPWLKYQPAHLSRGFSVSRLQSSDGTVAWRTPEVIPGAHDTDTPAATVVDRNGDIVVTGFRPDSVGLTIKYAGSTGAVKWWHEFSANSETTGVQLARVLANSNGGFTIAGNFGHPRPGGSDYFVAKLDESPLAPAVSTRPASQITPHGAALNLVANTRGEATEVWFEYGVTPDLGSSTTKVLLAPKAIDVEGRELITGLAPNTQYYYRAVGTNATGESIGNVLSFNTLPQPTIDPIADVTVLEDSGEIIVKLTGIQATSALSASSSDPLLIPHPTISYTSGADTAILLLTPRSNSSGTVVVNVHARDHAGGTPIVVGSFKVQVQSVNDAPRFQKGPDQQVLENAGWQVVAGWAHSLHPGADDEIGQILTFRLTSDNPSLFKIQPSIDSDGVLTYSPMPNASGASNVTVRLGDDGGTENGGLDSSQEAHFQIVVKHVNKPPRFQKGGDLVIREDAGDQMIKGWATGIHPGAEEESGQQLAFEAVNDNPGLFSVPPSIDRFGTLTFTSAPDANGVASVTIRLRDDGGGIDSSAEARFNITVTPVNDPPSFISGGDVHLPRAQGPQVIDSWAGQIGPGAADELGQSFDFELTFDNPGMFETSPAVDPNGRLTFALSADANGVALCSVRLRDDGGKANGGNDSTGRVFFTITVGKVEGRGGTYNGLIEPNGSDPKTGDDFGLIHLTKTRSGQFSGKIKFGQRRLSFRGEFDETGQATFGHARHSSLHIAGQKEVGAMALNFSLGDDSRKLYGTLTFEDGEVARIEADKSFYNAAVNPPAPLLGRYTVVTKATPPTDESLATEGALGGYGSGVARVGRNGSVRLVVKLPTGERIGYASYLSRENRWPFYKQVRPRSTIAGWGEFMIGETETVLNANELVWFRSPDDGGIDSESWPHGVLLELSGQKYEPVKRGSIPGLPPLSANGNLKLEIHRTDGNTTLVSQGLNLARSGRVQSIPTNPAEVSMVFHLDSGRFKGTYKAPKALRLTPFEGVWLQESGFGLGFSRNKSEIGTVVLEFTP